MKVDGRGKMWTKEEENYLKANYNTMTYKEIGDHLGRSASSTGTKAASLGLRKHKAPRVVKNVKPWTEYQLIKSGEIVSFGTLKEIESDTGLERDELLAYRKTQDYDDYTLYAENEVS